jgi:hypothetical protein
VLQSLLLTALGGVLGVGGALLASQWQAREARRVRKEQEARDDRYRLMNERIMSYRAFYIAAGAARHVIERQAQPQDIVRARDEMWEAFTLVALIGDEKTWGQARSMLRMVSAVAFEGSPFNIDAWDELIRSYIQVSRLDLIPTETVVSGLPGAPS